MRTSLAFRGGTALYKLHIKPAARYSEDIDLVQVKAEPAGPILEALRETLDPWLGNPRWNQGEARVTLNYRFDSEATPSTPLRLKIEINTREHFAVYGFIQQPYEVTSRWFKGSCHVYTYELNELLGTKLRALYQRRKGRDLFDLAVSLKHAAAEPDRIAQAFMEYMNHQGVRVTRRQFEENLAAKLEHPGFAADIGPLLASGFEWDLEAMSELVMSQLINRLPG